MKKIALILATVFLLGLAIPASADTLSSTPVDSTAVTATSDSTVSGTVYNQPSVQVPIDLNTLNSLSIAQLKELQKQIQNVLKQKEESLKEFEGKITTFDGSSVTVQGKNGTQTFTVTSETEVKVTDGSALQAGYKAEIKYDPNTSEAVIIKAELILLEYSGMVVSYDGKTITVKRGNEQKTFNITDKTKIEGLGKAKGTTEIKAGTKVGIKYTSAGNAVTIKVIPAKEGKKQENTKNSTKTKIQENKSRHEK
ncbi:hypothetical protein SAMN02746089_01150 [Caldanaerobius fijiensis DSM 17918]|uniref:DUF5666 domain-containing protein n=1 Tax=Caldanaerobius fijiensis DSM 17918 TaxID=1121256 RepID=A0A1M4Y3Y9_9THEO|nr:DUF5666 domain-containing protein [Caldanaerobius fijiensis]SHF00461.1 hypothetical protein SAMN02746089_01150 [Caldanaerobius fijiensis DSM 17918]